MSKTGKELKTANETLNAQLAAEAQRQCLSLCAVLQEKLPREIRAMVYDFLIEEKNATFFDGPNSTVKLANGSSKVPHCFDADYTGATVHLEILEELKHLDIRFDFRHRHNLVQDAFDYYRTVHDFDLAPVITRAGVVLNSSDIIARDQVSTKFNEFARLQRGSDIHVFVQTSGRTNDGIARSFRRVIRAAFPMLKSLCLAGHDVTIIMNPKYRLSPVRNGTGSQFSIIPEQTFLYVFSTLEANTCAAQIETELIMVSTLTLKHFGTELIDDSITRSTAFDSSPTEG